MSDTKKINENVNATSLIKDEKDIVTINLQPFLMPASILLSVIILSTSLLVGLNNVGVGLKNLTLSTSTTGSTTSSQTSSTQATATTVSLDQIKGLFSASGNLKFGDTNKKLLFVEFSDPSCPYCHVASGKDAELNKQFGAQFTLAQDGGTYVAPVIEMKKLVDSGQAAFVYQYTQGHGSGEIGAQAFYCANEKGKFWDVHDYLMSNVGYTFMNAAENAHAKKNPTAKEVTQGYRIYTDADLNKMADFLKNVIDQDFMKGCLLSHKYESKLAEDANTASGFGIQGTPGFFVNNSSYPGAYSFKDMQTSVDTALKS